MVTGSVVSSLQGEPRSTHDIDVVISLCSECSPRLIQQFPAPDFYLDENAVSDAVARKSMFNLLDVNGGDKVDFWMLTGEQYDLARWARRVCENILGEDVMVSAPEDTILAKLNWARMCGGSEKQFTDALRVYEVQLGKLDLDYLHDWAKKLGVEDLLERLESQATA